MQNEGWIKLHRALMDDDSSFQTLTVIQQIIAIYILLKANHKDAVWNDKHHGEQVKVSRGQLVASRATIKSWFPNDDDISEQKIRTAIKKLQKINFLTKQSTKGYSVLTVVNYELYQKKDEDSNQAPNQGLTNPQPTPNQGLTTNKNEEECFKNGEEDIVTPLAKKKSTPKLSQIPSDWSLSEDVLAWTIQKNPSLNVSEEVEQFKDWHTARKNTMANWDAAWRTWVRNGLKFGKTTPPSKTQVTPAEQRKGGVRTFSEVRRP